jgi:hypothetical protein
MNYFTIILDPESNPNQDPFLFSDPELTPLNQKIWDPGGSGSGSTTMKDLDLDPVWIQIRPLSELFYGRPPCNYKAVIKVTNICTRKKLTLGKSNKSNLILLNIVSAFQLCPPDLEMTKNIGGINNEYYDSDIRHLTLGVHSTSEKFLSDTAMISNSLQLEQYLHTL